MLISRCLFEILLPILFVAKWVPLSAQKHHSEEILVLSCGISDNIIFVIQIALFDIPRRVKLDKASFSDSILNKKYSVAILLIDSLSQLSFTR